MVALLDSLLEQTSSVRAPIPGDAPGGADVTLDAEFERIKAEIDKLSSIEGGQVDWRFVAQTSEELLSSKAKDLRLALWMACGAVERSGWSGLARSLVVCRAMVVDFWETMFPPVARAKARVNILSWFGERVTPGLAQRSISMSDGDAVRLSAQLVDEIDRALSDKLGEAYSGMGGLLNALRARVRDIPEPRAAEPTPARVWADDDDDDGDSSASSSSSSDAPGPVGASSSSASVSSSVLSVRAADADATTRACSDALVQLSKAMVAANPAQAWAYRLHRTAIWLPVQSAPIAVAGPSAETRAAVHAAFAAGKWHELLVVAEAASAECALWLDAQRYAALALDRLGVLYVDAREAVGRDASDFVRRWPKVVEQVFEDQTALADDETREWLHEEATRWQLVVSRAADVAKDEDLALRRRFEEARDLVQRGHHAEGLALAMQLARRGADTRDRFRSNLAVARLAMSVGAKDVARPVLDGLFTTAEAHNLEAWEPTLCARLYSEMVGCLRGDDAATERSALLFDRLCRLDPAAALRSRTPLRTNGHAVANGGAVEASAPQGNAYDDDD